MNNKILIGLLVVLGVIAITETVYISNIRQFPLRDDWGRIYHGQSMMPAWAHDEVPGYNNLNNWHPAQEIEQFYDNMDRMFRERWARDSQNTKGIFSDRNVFYVPPISVKETPPAYILSADLPGMKKEDIKVEENGDLLTISGQRKNEEKTQNQETFREEQNYGYFARSLTLPSDVKPGVINTQYNNGVLEVILPRSAK